MVQKLIVYLLIIFLGSINVYAQHDEPVSNVGRTLNEVKQEFPNLLFFGNDKDGEEYISKDLDGGDVSFHFVSKNGIIVKEFLKSQDKDGFSVMMFNQFCNTFIGKYKWALQNNTATHKHFVFTRYTLDISLTEENGMDTMLFMYKRR